MKNKNVFKETLLKADDLSYINCTDESISGLTLNGETLMKNYFHDRIEIALLEIGNLKKYLMKVKKDHNEELQSKINKLHDKLDDRQFEIAEKVTNNTVNKVFVNELRVYTCYRYQEIDDNWNNVYREIASAAEAKKTQIEEKILAAKVATEEKIMKAAAAAEKKKREAEEKRETIAASDEKRKGVAEGIRTAIVGFFQEGRNKHSKGEIVISHRWTNTNVGITIQKIGEGAAWTKLHWEGNHFYNLIFSSEVSESDRCIVGFNQVCSDITSTAPWVTKHSWGDHRKMNGRKKTYIGSNKAWSSDYGWGNSEFYIWCNTNVIVGFMQVHTNKTSTATEIVGRRWGINRDGKGIHKRIIGTGYAWHPKYHWGYSTRYLFIKEK
mmetsp:Transcript_14034/g.17183  ORF Transcript_14034/g.17183 Transcript_14034/m.17183 type:complete len:382 (+) Transcript_14034:79-1224(+)